MLKRPSIAYYESDQVPLFHNMGRHQARSAIAGNIFWALPSELHFPGCWNQDGQWFTMRIPVELLNRDDQGKYVIASRLNLRNFQEHNRACRSLYLDNLRLDGPAGVRLIDSFDDSARWQAALAQCTTITSSTDKTQGTASQQIAWAAVPSNSFYRRFAQPVPEPFTSSQYTHLKLDMKYEGARPYMHVRDLGEQIDLGDQALLAQLASATAEQKQQDAYGRVSYETYIRADTKMIRQIVLTVEGYLVVRDQITPGLSMEGWNAGQLWQLYTLANRGQDWFCAEDDGAYPIIGSGSSTPRATDTRRMLVRFGHNTDSAVNVEQVKQTYFQPNPKGRAPDAFYTTFSQRRMHAGQTESFAFAVLPHDPKVGTPEDVAKSISVATLPDGTAEVTVSPVSATGQVTVRLAAQNWSVLRSK